MTIPKSPNPPQSHNPGNDWVLGAKSGSDSSDLIAFNQVGGLIANAIYIYIYYWLYSLYVTNFCVWYLYSYYYPDYQYGLLWRIQAILAKQESFPQTEVEEQRGHNINA